MELATIFLATLAVCVGLYYFIIKTLLYFKLLEVPYVQPVPLLGNTAPFILRRLSLLETIHNTYCKFPDAKYYGFYDLMTPIYVLRDPDLINTVTIKNFDHFCNHRAFINSNAEPIACKNLFDLRDDQWRQTRRRLTPVFTSNKIKMMYRLICQCAENLVNFIVSEAGSAGKTFDTKDLICRYANDVVATTAFGVNVDSFNEPNNEFFLIGQKAMKFDSVASLKIVINRNLPWLANLLQLKFFAGKVENFFKQIISESVRIRCEQKIVRSDMIHLMMETKDANGKSMFDIEDMAAQAILFFLAGFETTSSTMCFMMQELAANPDIQSRLYAEVKDVLEQTNGKPTYEAINGMRYMDAVITETMRMYPLLSLMDRVCVKEFVLPPPIPTGKPITLKPGDVVWFQSYAIHHDSKYYSRPDDFVPERYLNGEAVNSPYIPFGIGPRICIANRFALIEMKIMLFHLIQRCVLELDSRTQIPVVLSKKSFLMTADGGFWLKLRTRDSDPHQIDSNRDKSNSCES